MQCSIRWKARSKNRWRPSISSMPWYAAGNDVSLITYGGSLFKALQAAELLAADGVSAEVIDLRVLRPLDMPTVLQSVGKTHRAIIVDEGWRTCSLAAEIRHNLWRRLFTTSMHRSDAFAAPKSRCPMRRIWNERHCHNRSRSFVRCARC